ncbi:MAG: endonuclease MutS2, partial [Clostridium celatum]|nr:endonuclease MutS2 [Clostridium celatum]
MKERTLRILEFNKVKNKLRSYAVTSGGKELIDALSPYKSIYEVENKLEETNEALDILIKKGIPPFEGLHETKEELERAGKGGTLNPGQLMKIGAMLRCSRRFKEYISRKEEEVGYRHLEDLASILVPLKNLENEIDSAIISEDEISDKASGTLYNIRRSLKEKNSSVREKINSIVRSNSKYLQDSLYTMRGD